MAEGGVGPMEVASASASLIETPSTSGGEAVRPKLRDFPDWGYVFREFYEMYRHSSAGGSAAIRKHQRSVRETLSKILETNPDIALEQPETKPVCAHLKRALDEGRLERTASVIRAIESVHHQLVWRYGYDRIPRGLSQKYAYAEFMGPTGPALSSKLILGLVLFAPKTTYPAHSHEGVTESYFVLSGAVSENDDGVFGPGSLIFNPPGRNHRITTGEHEPSLLAYAWIGPEEKLCAQKMTFSRARGASSAKSGVKSAAPKKTPKRTAKNPPSPE